MADPQIWGAGTLGRATGGVAWGDTTIVCDSSGGRLLLVDPSTGSIRPWGDGYHGPQGISVISDERAVIAETGGALLVQPLLTPGRVEARVVADGLGSLRQLVVAPDESTAIVTDHDGGRVLRVDLVTGAVARVVDGLDQPVGVAFGPQNALLVTEQGSGRLLSIGPDGEITTLLSGFEEPTWLSWADGDLLLAEQGSANRLGRVDLAGPTWHGLVRAGVPRPAGAVKVDDRLLVCADGRIVVFDLSRGLTPDITVSGPSTGIWPGSWSELAVDTALSGYLSTDLAYTVEPVGLATVSDHRAENAPRPSIRLLAYGQTGPGEIVVSEQASGAELARQPFSIELTPTQVDGDGPPLWIEGPAAAPPPVTALDVDYGVRDTGALTPRDRNGQVLPQWRVALILVDTSSARWTPADIGSATTLWTQALSVANGYYTEVSGGALTIGTVNSTVYGPVALSGDWDDNFKKTSSKWRARPGVFNAAAAFLAAANVDIGQVDALAMVVRSSGVDAVWPHAPHAARRTTKDLAGVDVMVSEVYLPSDIATVGPGHAASETLTHELGHTLGLPDLYMSGNGYTDDMKARDLDHFELMSDDQGLPSLCARHKLLLGFIDHNQVPTLEYGHAADKSIDLWPLADGNAPAHGAVAVELRVAPRVSWFFEYRRAVPGRVADTGQGGGQIICYEAWNTDENHPAVIADKRAAIVLLRPDPNGVGPLLARNDTYSTLDTDDPLALSTFEFIVVDDAHGRMQVRARVRDVQQPDPSIRPNPGYGDYQSPDIEIRNVYSDVDPTFKNRPVKRVQNRVVATITNIGGLPAPSVVVRFKVLPFDTDDPKSQRWQDLGDPVQHDVDAGAHVEFETQWVPPEDRHYCIQARIDRYTSVPGASADEPDVDNNLAQSNYFKIFSKPKSPASRESTLVDVHNPYPFPATATIELRQDTPGFRSYVDRQWIGLAAGETRPVRIEVESTAREPWQALEPSDGRTWMRAWFDLPDGHSSGAGTGVSIASTTALATTVRESKPGGVTHLYLQVVAEAEGLPSPQVGSAVADIDYTDGTSGVVGSQLWGDGQLNFDLDRPALRAAIRYSGAPGYCPCGPVPFEIAPAD